MILAGISIQFIVGDNGIIAQSVNAREETEISQERELIQQAVVSAAGKDRYGNLSSSTIQSELDILTGEDETKVTDIEGGFGILFIECRHYYLVDNNGKIVGISEQDDNNESGNKNNIELTDEYIKIDDEYIDVYFNLNKIEIPQFGMNIEYAKIFKYNEKYYFVKVGNYLQSENDIQNFINANCIELNVDKGFVTPDSNTEAGDIKLENGRAYVFEPYEEHYESWNDPNYWEMLDEYIPE